MATVDTLLHADVYRTGSLGEVVELALAELVEERAIALIEWGDMAAPAVGNDVVEVTLELPDPGSEDATGSAGQRVICLTGRGRWSGRAEEIERALSSASARSGS